MTIETTFPFPTNMTAARQTALVFNPIQPKLRIKAPDETSSKPAEFNWLKALTETGTDNPDRNIYILSDEFVLEQAAVQNDERAFMQIARQIDWNNRQAQDYVWAVRLALQAGAHGFARHLSQEGGRRFPEHAEMQQLAYLLAPARVIQLRQPADPRSGLDMRWLKEHGNEYRGQWVALEYGELVAVASNARELLAKMENPRNKNIMVTKVY